MSIQPGPGAEVLRIGRGDRLALDVAKHCRQLAINAQFDPDAVELARQVCTWTSRRDLDAYAAMIRAALGRSFLFVNDPRDAEALKSVGDMARDIFSEGVTRGDCDEAAALGAGLALCVGFERVELVLEKHWRADQPYEHIFAEVLGESGWMDLDTTRHPGMGHVPIAGYLRCEV
jgi:hypothetical protein